MEAAPEPRDRPTDLDPVEPSPTVAIVNLTAGIGLTVCIGALLVSSDTFSFGRVALALLLAVPFLLYARLAARRRGAEALVAGVLLVAVGTWGSITAMGDGSTSDFIQLAFSLVIVELAVFGIGSILWPASSRPPG
jgi:hypothetical protein